MNWRLEAAGALGEDLEVGEGDWRGESSAGLWAQGPGWPRPQVAGAPGPMAVPNVGRSEWEGGSQCHGLPDSTLFGGLAFPASHMPSATAAAGSPQGCSLILGSHTDMLTHACTPPASTPRHSPAPHAPVYPSQLGVRLGPQARGIPLLSQLAGTSGHRDPGWMMKANRRGVLCLLLGESLGPDSVPSGCCHPPLPAAQL